MIIPAALFIRHFVQKERQKRYLALAESPKRYGDFVNDLLHDGRHLEHRKMRRLHKASLSIISQDLHALGAGKTCYVLAAGPFDATQQEMNTAAALLAVVGSARDCLLFFPEALLAYYENHEGEQYILKANVGNTSHSA